MVFSSLIFLFRFLPAVMIVYKIVPPRVKNAALFFMSLIFYAWGEPVYVWLMVFSAAADFGHGLLVGHFLEQGQKCRARWALISSVTVNLALLGFFKYGDFFLRLAGSILGRKFAPMNLTLPVGISFYTFQTMSYTIDVYRGEVPVQKNFWDFGCYVAMFPQLIAGPIVRFKTIASQLKGRKLSAGLFAQGLTRLTVGMAKKVLLANNAGRLWKDVLGGRYGADPLAAWLGAAAFGFQIYFDFSGYSDMAIGLGKMLGFVFPENFNYPYISQSLTEFWRRWHITLGQWFREYVYIPLGGSRNHPVRNIAVVWLLTGLWHGAALNFVLWGIYFCILLLIEKFLLGEWQQRWPSWLRRVYTLAAVFFGWMIFACQDMAAFTRQIGAMFGMAGADSGVVPGMLHGLAGGAVLARSHGAAGLLEPGNAALAGSGIYALYTNALLFVAMIFGATPLPARLASRLMARLHRSDPRFLAAALSLKIVAGLSAWSLCLAELVDMTYNPFLYFRF